MLNNANKMNGKKRLRCDLPLLKLLADLSDNERDVLLKSLAHSRCESIFDCLHQGLYNTTLPPEFIKEVRKKYNKKDKTQRAKINKLRSLVKPDVSPGKKHKTLIQLGGDISFFLKNILPVLEDHLRA